MSEKEKHNIRISNDREIALQLGNQDHIERISKIGSAISSPIRLQMMDILMDTPRSLQEIAHILDIPLSSVASHIQKLEEAGLVVSENQPGLRGTMRVCICCLDKFTLAARNEDVASKNKNVSVEMPIGNYYSCNISPTCGLADENGVIGAFDAVNVFYSPRRTRAQLIWFTTGSIEYRFPNVMNRLLSPDSLTFSMEICSEAPGFLEDYPSDITISVYDREILTYTCPGDYGARRGKLTPDTWANGSTQYGLLKNFSLRTNGVYIDEKRVDSSIRLGDFSFYDKPYISLGISVKKNAAHPGGINIFGRKYGDYPQGIIMTISYR